MLTCEIKAKYSFLMAASFASFTGKQSVNDLRPKPVPLLVLNSFDLFHISLNLYFLSLVFCIKSVKTSDCVKVQRF